MDGTKAGLALTAAILAAGMTYAAEAAALRDPTEALFSVGDKNADGRLEIDELRDLRRARFERLDRNRDGGLSAAELESAGRRADRAAALEHPRTSR